MVNGPSPVLRPVIRTDFEFSEEVEAKVTKLFADAVSFVRSPTKSESSRQTAAALLSYSDFATAGAAF